MAQSFNIAVADAVLTDLKDRLAHTRSPAPLYADDREAGLQPEYLADLIRYWREDFDWRVAEAGLNRFDQFVSDVDATRIHFLHQKGSAPQSMPLLLLHGYPDSFYRFA